MDKVEKLSGQKTQVLQIWSEKTLLKSYDLSELDKHKNVYTSGFFGTTMVWDQSAQKLAYLAEKKVAKAKPFFSSHVKKMDNAEDQMSDAEKTDLKVRTKFILIEISNPKRTSSYRAENMPSVRHGESNCKTCTFR